MVLAVYEINSRGAITSKNCVTSYFKGNITIAINTPLYNSKQHFNICTLLKIHDAALVLKVGMSRGKEILKDHYPVAHTAYD